MERILFGDNQFFGINHMSEEKARQQAMRFQDIDNIVDVLQSALHAGAGGFMCTTHDTIEKIADRVRADREAWKGFTFYPGMPYAHKYANAVTELGYFDAMRKFLPSEGLVDTMLRGGKAVLNRDIEGMMTLLVDAEMKMFRGLDTPVIFLQNVVTDLVQGLGIVDAFRIFAEHCKKRYNAEAGFITMNLPMLLPMLKEAGIENPIVCANVNKIAFRMSGGIEGYREATTKYPARVIAMSVLGSGAIRPSEAIEWVVNEPYVESILFGASSKANIVNTVDLIREHDAKRATSAA
ncbi:hypothetical protein EWE75_22040 [Sphingomonas populi]|uniref:Uncharacterized protein n=1 Tax=Sphingomonas populi TaxID=2484750 RepID=A0A4Q6XUV2_9SPHN|nr:hypothetical protein [Sphingomonas populi]RZF60649.1 hypothetical protein EWE75_22040 [Sphingomonas populi]